MYSAFMDYGEVLVTGGTGFLGREVVRGLAARGILPRLLVRDGSEGRIPADIRKVCRVTPGDVTDPDSVENAAQGTSAIVHLAGIIREIPAKGITFDRLHVKATRNVVRAARRWEISRLVHVSALGARPGDPSAFFDSKGRGEEVVRNSDLRWTVFRPSAIFGPGDRFIDTLARLVARAPVAPVPGDGRVRFQPVFVGDVAEAVADSVSRPGTEERSIDVGGPESLTLDEIVEAVAESSGRRIAAIHVPLGLVRFAARSLSRFRAFPFSPQEIDFLAADNVCESGPFWCELGRAPRYLKDCLAEIVAGQPRAPADLPGAGVGSVGEDKPAPTAPGMEPPSRKAA